MKKQKQTRSVEIVYVSGESMKYENLTERQAKRIRDAHVRDMAIRGIKRVSYGVALHLLHLLRRPAKGLRRRG
jgi:hypothetical protein